MSTIKIGLVLASCFLGSATRPCILNLKTAFRPYARYILEKASKAHRIHIFRPALSSHFWNHSFPDLGPTSASAREINSGPLQLKKMICRFWRHPKRKNSSAKKDTIEFLHRFYTALDPASSFQPNEKTRLKGTETFEMIDQGEGVFHIKLPTFSRAQKSWVQSLREWLGQTEARAIILDLRGHPGGEFKVAVELVSLFSNEEVIGQIQFFSGDKGVLHSRVKSLFGGPLEIWMDHQTASSAEFIAQSLAEAGRAVLKGDRSFGKSTIQKVALFYSKLLKREIKEKISYQMFLGRDGSSIHQVGLLPTGPI